MGESSVVVAYRGRRSKRYVADDLGPDPGGSSVDSGVGEAAGVLSQPEPYRFEKSPGRCGEKVVAGEVVVSVDRFAKAVKKPG